MTVTTKIRNESLCGVRSADQNLNSHFREEIYFRISLGQLSIAQLFISKRKVISGQQIYDEFIAIIVVPNLNLHSATDQLLLHNLLLKKQ